MKKVALWSAFFLAVVMLAFLFYPVAVWLVRSVNDGVSSGCLPGGQDYSGWCWSNPYTRFIPTEYEGAAALALDAGLALMCVSGLFYGVPLVAKRKHVVATITVPTSANGKRRATTARRRLLLIPAWFLAQYIWNLFSGMSFSQALGMMTSIQDLWYSAVVVTIIVIYAKNYQVAFGKGTEDSQKRGEPEK